MDVLTCPDLFRLVIATRNSGRHLRHFLQSYRSLGIRPFYVLDSRSTDDTAELLRAAGADVVEVTPEADRVEAMIGLLGTLCRGTRWLLRLDDDEFPSEVLLKWIAANLADIAMDVIQLPRRWCIVGDDGVACYSAAETFFWHPERPDLSDPQPRLFRPDRVAYCSAIHSAGFDLEKAGFAPSAAHLCHFDWVVRTAAERIAKIRAYEAQSHGAGLGFLRFYLPEAADPRRHRRIVINDAGIAALARSLSDNRVARLLCSHGTG